MPIYLNANEFPKKDIDLQINFSYISLYNSSCLKLYRQTLAKHLPSGQVSSSSIQIRFRWHTRHETLLTIFFPPDGRKDKMLNVLTVNDFIPISHIFLEVFHMILQDFARFCKILQDSARFWKILKALKYAVWCDIE